MAPLPVDPPPSVSLISPPGPSADAVRLTNRGRWARAAWEDLPGWGEDSVQQAWPALLRSCDRHSTVAASALLNGTTPTALAPSHQPHRRPP